MRRIWSLLLSLCLVSCLLSAPVQAWDEGNLSHQVAISTVHSLAPRQTSLDQSGPVWGTQRQAISEGKEGVVYRICKAEIAKIASGERSSATISIPLGALLGTSESRQWVGRTEQEATDAMMAELDIDLDSVVYHLLADCPYDLYWFAKTIGLQSSCSYTVMRTGTSYRITKAPSDSAFDLLFAVDPKFADTSSVVQIDGERIYTALDLSRTGAARQAVDKAAEIVRSYAGYTDYEKLQAYAQAIWDLTDFDLYAASLDSPTDFGPWQLLYVFDDLPDTKVVCEGYAKAFKYLCDRTDFDGAVSCYLLTGDLIDRTGAGAHMWNLVRIDDQYYLADLTNCDTDGIGYPDLLFLRGIADTSDGGFALTCHGTRVQYLYDRDVEERIWGSGHIPTLSGKDLPYIAADSVRASVHIGETLAQATVQGEALTGVQGQRLSGQWQFLSPQEKITESGRYPVRFTPFDSHYAPVTVSCTVEATAQSPVPVILSISDSTGAVDGARIELDADAAVTVENTAPGTYTAEILPGIYQITISAGGYLPLHTTLTVPGNLGTITAAYVLSNQLTLEGETQLLSAQTLITATYTARANGQPLTAGVLHFSLSDTLPEGVTFQTVRQADGETVGILRVDRELFEDAHLTLQALYTTPQGERVEATRAITIACPPGTQTTELSDGTTVTSIPHTDGSVLTRTFAPDGTVTLRDSRTTSTTTYILELTTTAQGDTSREETTRQFYADGRESQKSTITTLDADGTATETRITVETAADASQTSRTEERLTYADGSTVQRYTDARSQSTDYETVTTGTITETADGIETRTTYTETRSSMPQEDGSTHIQTHRQERSGGQTREIVTVSDLYTDEDGVFHWSVTETTTEGEQSSTVITQAARRADGTEAVAILDSGQTLLQLTGFLSRPAVEAAGESPVTLPGDFAIAPETTISLSRDVRLEGLTCVAMPTGALSDSLTCTEIDSGTPVPLSGIENNRLTIALTDSALSVHLTDQTHSYRDVALDAWYAPAVAFVSAREIFQGVSTDSFAPALPLSRAMLMQVLYNLQSRQPAQAAAPLSDVAPDAWYAPAVDWGYEVGILQGYEDGTFRASNPVTRQDFATMLTRAMARYDLPGAAQALTQSAQRQSLPFTDADAVADYALGPVAYLSERGILQGLSDHSLAPTAQANRAQAATMLQRLCAYILREGS